MLTNPPAFSMPFNYSTLDMKELWVYERENPRHGPTRVRQDRRKIGVFGGCTDHKVGDAYQLDSVTINLPDSNYDTVEAGNIVFGASVQPHPMSWKCVEYCGQRYFHHPDYVLYPSAEESGWFQHKDVVAKLKAEAEKAKSVKA